MHVPTYEAHYGMHLMHAFTEVAILNSLILRLGLIIEKVVKLSVKILRQKL